MCTDLELRLQKQIRELDDTQRRLDRLLDYLAISQAIANGSPRGALAIAFRQKGAQKA